eukprot:CAMPEP_0114981866 /NCGR_PEP_ID=MMETSP0216-20121206/5778_1 /TAXON_ID=223996 /ORGANISM="Protocruzia adherens, Strain Boccale" /LENGTH=1008 /DNA_ID=CAMNT_0002343577 /DNA_START=148 /DNA_END=3174 /DNA_ORIENTATION=-
MLNRNNTYASDGISNVLNHERRQSESGRSRKLIASANQIIGNRTVEGDEDPGLLGQVNLNQSVGNEPLMRSGIKSPGRVDMGNLDDSQLSGRRSFSRQELGLDIGPGPLRTNEMESKVTHHQRMIMTLVEQVRKLEGQVNHIDGKHQFQYDQDRDARLKLENDLRATSDYSKFSAQEVLNRLAQLEESAKRDEGLKLELREKLRNAELNQKELMGYIKNMEKSEDSELSQMRLLLQEKASEDHSSNVKQKEKANVLFGEVVRLGEQHEKSAEFLQSLSVTVESRLQTLESRLSGSERTLFQVDKKGESGVNLVSDLAERMDKRIQVLETTLQAVANDQRKDETLMQEIDTLHAKNHTDVKSTLGQFQSDLNHKIEFRVQEIVNRIVAEQEERIKNAEEIKYHFEVKDRLNQEKQSYDKEEMKDRYNTMDSMVRAEFQRKDEAILHLQQSLDLQVRSLHAAIKQEEVTRNQQEVNLRLDVNKLHDQMRGEVETFKKHQASALEKVADMIRTEVDSRVSADHDIKNLVNALVKGVNQDIVSLKEFTEKAMTKLNKDLKSYAADSAERAQLLSRYVDEEFKKAVDHASRQHEKIKRLCAQLTEQLKQNLINFEAWKAEAIRKILKLEDGLLVTKSDLEKLIEFSENRTWDKIKSTRETLDQHFTSNTKVLEERVDQLTEMTDASLDALKGAMQNNRDVFVSMINKLNEEIEARHNNSHDDLGTMTGEIAKMQDFYVRLTEKINENAMIYESKFADFESQLTVKFTTEKAVRQALLDNMQEQSDFKFKEVDIELNTANERIEREEELQIENTNENIKTLNEHDAYIEQITENYEKLKKAFEESLEKRLAERCNLESGQVLESMLANLEAGGLHENLKQIRGEVNEQNAIINGFVTDFEGKVANVKPQAYDADQEAELSSVKDNLSQLVDKKIAHVLEKLKLANESLWAESVKLAEEEFSKKGIEETKSLLPRELVNSEEDYLKVINQLHSDFEKSEASGRPRLAGSAGGESD